MTALEALARMSDEELFEAIAAKVVSSLRKEKRKEEEQEERPPESSRTIAEYLTKAETAQLLKVSTRTVERWAQNGTMPSALNVNGCMRWEKSAVLMHCKQH